MPKRKNPVALTMEGIFGDNLSAFAVSYILGSVAGSLTHVATDEAILEGIEKLYENREQILLGLSLMKRKIKKDATVVMEAIKTDG